MTPWPRVRSTIGLRLTASFAAVVLLMLLGGAIAMWQFDVLRSESRRLQEMERQEASILRVHNDVLLFGSSMQRALHARDKALVQAESARQRTSFVTDVDRALTALRDPAEGDRHGAALITLQTIRASVLGQAEATQELAGRGDWAAAASRLENQARFISGASGRLVEEIDAALQEERAVTEQRIGRIQRRALSALVATVLLTLLLAMGLGFAVTRSITRPLAQLDAGAAAVAAGGFHHRVAPKGRDELAALGRAFNEMSSKLEGLYEALRRSEAHFRSLIENSSDVVVLLDAEGRVRYASPSLGRILGHADADILGRPLLELVHPEDQVRFEEAVAVPAKGARTLADCRFRHRDGSWRALEAVATNLLEDPAVGAIVLNARDVSERRDAEEKLHEAETQLQESLRRSETMAAMGLLVAGVAHEVRNPLFGISANLDAFESRLASEPELRPVVALMRREVDRLGRLMNDLLEYGKPGGPSLRLPESAASVVAEAVQHCLSLAQSRGVLLVNAVPVDLSSLLMDRARLVQVFQNLLENAVQHSPPGGRVVAEGEQHGGDVVLVVRDSGPGVSPDDLPRLFEPFFSRRREGTGLGLAIVQRIVEEHGGVVSASNGPRGGAVITVRLPCRAPAVAGLAGVLGSDR